MKNFVVKFEYRNRFNDSLEFLCKRTSHNHFDIKFYINDFLKKRLYTYADSYSQLREFIESFLFDYYYYES